MIPPSTNPISGLPYGVRFNGGMETPGAPILLHFTDVGGTGSTFTVPAATASQQTILDALIALRARFAAPPDVAALVWDTATDQLRTAAAAVRNAP